MDQDEMYLPELDDIEPDVALAAAVDLEMDIIDFCISQLEVEMAVTDEMNVEEDEFLVSLHHFTKVKGLAYQFRTQIYDGEIADDDEEATINAEESMEQVSGICNQLPGAQYLLMDDEDHGRPIQPQKDIIEIVSRCLKEAKKLKSARTIKIMTQLTAVAEYVKLRAHYFANNRSTKPCTNASLAIARRMGKDKYFARKIRENERFLLCHGHLPQPKVRKKGGQWTLLDNQDILQKVRVYLASQKLGTITPNLLCKHVNDIILPTLELTEKKASICERTAVNWLYKLGYECKDVKKGIYVDGHERCDVVENRKKFLEEMDRYSR